MAGSVPPEHEVLARRFEIIVLDAKRAGAVPSADRLRVLSNGFDVGDIGIEDVRRGAVQGDPALLPQRRIAVDVAPIDDQIVRHTREVLLCAAAIAEEHDVAVAPAFAWNSSHCKRQWCAPGAVRSTAWALDDLSLASFPLSEG